MDAQKAAKTNVLTVDVGNTTTKLGLFSADALAGTWEITTHTPLTVDEAHLCLQQALAILGADCLQGAILACVVPALADVWRTALIRACEKRVLVVGPGLKTGVRMRYDNPSEVGADRVADIVAAHHDYGAPAIIVDLGTTTNFEVIDDRGSFVGGIIAPGMALGAHALSQAAARLSMIELHAPTSIIGKNTRTAIQSGVVLGEVARIDGLLDALIRELKAEPEVPIVLTGDTASELAPLLHHSVRVDSNLTLHGLWLLWQHNQR